MSCYRQLHINTGDTRLTPDLRTMTNKGQTDANSFNRKFFLTSTYSPFPLLSLPPLSVLKMGEEKCILGNKIKNQNISKNTIYDKSENVMQFAFLDV